MLPPEPKHLAKRQENLHDDQNYDVPFDSQRAARLDETQGRFNRPGDQFELAVQGGEALENLKFIAETSKKPFQVGPVPQDFRRIIDLHAAYHLLLDRQRDSKV